MPQNKRIYKPYRPPRIETVRLFASAEEAWFWFVRCQKLRDQGVKPGDAMSCFQRPCEPDDIDLAVKRLYQQRELRREHLTVLVRFGMLERPPDRRIPPEIRAALVWKEALDKLSTALKHKGIIAPGSSPGRARFIA